MCASIKSESVSSQYKKFSPCCVLSGTFIYILSTPMSLGAGMVMLVILTALTGYLFICIAIENRMNDKKSYSVSESSRPKKNKICRISSNFYCRFTN